jgi:hypothetical protein
MIGVDVFTGDGNWRPCRLPGPLLCPLLCVLASRTSWRKRSCAHS